MKYMDVALEKGPWGIITETDSLGSIANSIKNILLSKPGNYPLTPNLGVDIERFIHEFADSTTEKEITNIIRSQLSQFIPDISDVSVTTRYLNNIQKNANISSSIRLGIVITLTYNNETVKVGTVVSKSNSGLIEYAWDIK